jgi:hypothetical protein
MSRLCETLVKHKDPCDLDDGDDIHKNPLCYIGDIIGGMIDGCAAGLIPPKSIASVLHDLLGASGVLGGIACDRSPIGKLDMNPG